MWMTLKRMLLPAVFAAGIETGWAGSFSSSVLVDATCRDRHWQTICTNEISLQLYWPSAATRADLAIVGMNGAFETNVTSSVSNVLWRAFASNIPETEDVYDLTLTFYTNDVSVAEVQSGRVAVAKGAFGAASIDAVADSRTWSRVKANEVVPYDALWAEEGTNAAASQIVIAKIDGAVQTNTFTDVSGYMGWKLRNSDWGYGAFELELTFAGMANAWTAELTRSLDGTAVSIR